LRVATYGNQVNERAGFESAHHVRLWVTTFALPNAASVASSHANSIAI
jgi:hypothetical protein